MDIQIQKDNESFSLGHVGPARVGEVYKISARVPLNVHGLYVGKDKRVTARRDQALETANFRRFTQRVSVVRDNEGRPTTTYGSNAVTLLVWDHPIFALHTIALVIDAGDAYAAQSTDSGFTMYNQGGPVVPALVRWKWEPGLLEEIVGDASIRHLPPATDYDEAAECVPQLGFKQGFVRWWNDAMGRGLLATNEGDATITRDHLVRVAPHQLRRLERGTVVTYDRLFSIESEESGSERRSSVKLGAYCVRPLPVEQALAATG